MMEFVYNRFSLSANLLTKRLISICYFCLRSNCIMCYKLIDLMDILSCLFSECTLIIAIDPNSSCLAISFVMENNQLIITVAVMMFINFDINYCSQIHWIPNLVILVCYRVWSVLIIYSCDNDSNEFTYRRLSCNDQLIHITGVINNISFRKMMWTFDFERRKQMRRARRRKITIVERTISSLLVVGQSRWQEMGIL